jgi:hypothetical protein
MAARLWLVKTRDDAGARHLATFVLTFDDRATVVAAVAGHSVDTYGRRAAMGMLPPPGRLKESETTMSDAEQGSVLGGVGEMVESGLEAVGHVVVAGVDVAQAGFDIGTIGVERFAAAGTEFIGAYAWRDEIDRASEYAEKDYHQHIHQAGKELSDAYTKMVGE